jgi:AbrB family looped-hinge helix DNA binding protein
MKTTIDQAGRVVIPAEIRREALLEPGTEIRIVYEGGVVRIERDVSPPRVEREGRFLRVRPTAENAPELDIPGLVRDERERWPF